MHASAILSSYLLALAATVQSLRITGPSTSEAIDLSQEITVTWSQSNSSEQKKWPTLDLEWFSKPTDLKSFGFEIASGLNTSDGQYKFTPSRNTIKTLQPFADELSKNKAFTFKITLRNGTDGETDVGPVVSGGKYNVIGLQKTTNAGAAVGLEWGALAWGIAAISFILV
ncbi:hypothetical protein ACHAPJ_012501 [Fusarium lateritium]